VSGCWGCDCWWWCGATGVGSLFACCCPPSNRAAFAAGKKSSRGVGSAGKLTEPETEGGDWTDSVFWSRTGFGAGRGVGIAAIANTDVWGPSCGVGASPSVLIIFFALGGPVSATGGSWVKLSMRGLPRFLCSISAHDSARPAKTQRKHGRSLPQARCARLQLLQAFVTCIFSFCEASLMVCNPVTAVLFTWCSEEDEASTAAAEREEGF